MRSRLSLIIAVLMLAMSLSAVAFAQSDDPNRPVAHPTEEGEDGNGGFFDRTPTSDEPQTDEDQSDEAAPDEDGSPAASPEASPVGPIESGDDLAAMVLDGSFMPEGYYLSGESYVSIDDLSSNLVGVVSADDLEATGMTGFYESVYTDGVSTQVRTYIIAYDSADGVQQGFDILENEELLVPNGAMTDLPCLDGVGEAPCEITDGTTTEPDGTSQATYDISFRIDRFEVGAASETFDGSEPDKDLVQSLARDLADRVNLVLAGGAPDGIDFSLPSQQVQLDGVSAYEGYEDAIELFPLTESGDLPDGFLSGYTEAYTYSDSPTSFYPLVTITSISMESADAVDEAMQTADLLVGFPDASEIDDFDAGVDLPTAAFAYTAGLSGSTEPDSVRVFVQVDSLLIVIDVQGEESLDAAQATAEALVEAQVDCIGGGDCSVILSGATV